MCENAYAVGYTGGSKEDIEEAHITNRQILAESGEQVLLKDD